MPQSDTILAIQADGTVAGLHTGDAAIDPDTISALEQYAAKVLCKIQHVLMCSTAYLAAHASRCLRNKTISERVSDSSKREHQIS